jgi:glutaminyl-peptide cyclotransferase
MKPLVGMLLLMLCAGCQEQAPPPRTTLLDPTLLKGEAAFEQVKTFTELGPKVAGAPSGKAGADWIKQTLESAGVAASIDSFDDKTPGGTNTFHNIEGIIPGDPNEIIVLGCHFDTKTGVTNTFVGANDSGSGVGLLIELGRVIQAHKKGGPEVRLAFFDGEECVVHYGPHDGFHGSKRMAKALVKAGLAPRVKAVIILDMVGHDDLTITMPRSSSPHLVSLVFDVAHALKVREQFRYFHYDIGDDHIAFLANGMPAVDLIDFQYGSAPTLNDYWHTGEDTLDKLSPQSLETVGRVVLEMINRLWVNDPEK